MSGHISSRIICCFFQLTQIISRGWHGWTVVCALKKVLGLDSIEEFVGCTRGRWLGGFFVCLLPFQFIEYLKLSIVWVLWVKKNNASSSPTTPMRTSIIEEEKKYLSFLSFIKSCLVFHYSDSLWLLASRAVRICLDCQPNASNITVS